MKKQSLPENTDRGPAGDTVPAPGAAPPGAAPLTIRATPDQLTPDALPPVSCPAPTPSTPILPSHIVTPSPSVVPAGVDAADCATCNGPSPVYALGQLDYDFGTEARRDSFVQHGLSNPHNPTAMTRHLSVNPSHATALTWVLRQDVTAIYAVMPLGAFAADTYATLREFLNGQLHEGVERVSIPGWVQGSTTLMNGQTVPLILPELRGMYSWSTPSLVEAALGEAPPETSPDYAAYQEKATQVVNFLERIYYEIRNLGRSSDDRAINYAATNAFQLEHVYTSALAAGMKLDSIAVERSPICRPESDCRDVKLTFFNPLKRLEQARSVYRFTIDVSDVVPVTVGPVRQWHVY